MHDYCYNVECQVLSQFKVSAALKYEQPLPRETRQRHQRKRVLVQSPLSQLHMKLWVKHFSSIG